MHIYAQSVNLICCVASGSMQNKFLEELRDLLEKYSAYITHTNEYDHCNRGYVEDEYFNICIGDYEEFEIRDDITPEAIAALLCGCEDVELDELDALERKDALYNS